MMRDLYYLMKGKASNEEIIKELTELYEEKIKEIKEHKKNYKKSKSEMDILEEKCFVKDVYCVNPSANFGDRISTTLKSFEPSNIKGVMDYMHNDMVCRLYTEWILNCMKEARDIRYVLKDMGISVDSSELENVFK